MVESRLAVSWYRRVAQPWGHAAGLVAKCRRPLGAVSIPPPSAHLPLPLLRRFEASRGVVSGTCSVVCQVSSGHCMRSSISSRARQVVFAVDALSHFAQSASPAIDTPSLDGVALGSRICRCLRSPGTPFAACDGDGDGNPFGNETDTRNCRTTTTTATITTTVSPPRFASHPSPDRPGAGDNSDRCHLDLDCSPQGLRIRPFRSPGARPRPVPTRHHQRHVRVEFRPPIPRLFVRSRWTGI